MERGAVVVGLLGGLLGSILGPIISANLSNKNNKSLNNYTLYNQKRHEIYPKIYQHLVKIVTYRSNPIRYELSQYSQSQYLSINELENFLNQFKRINQITKDEILKDFDNKRFTKLDKRFDQLIKAKKQQEYWESIVELGDLFAENECYFSESLGKSVTEIVDLLWELYTKYRRKEIYSEDRYFNDEKAISKVDKIEEQIDLMYEKIRNEVLQVKYSIQSELKEF